MKVSVPVEKRYGHLIEKWNAAREEMRQILIQCARERRTITYGELSERMRTINLHPFSYGMRGMLDEVSLGDEAQGRASLATLVVRKSDGRPGPGYFRKSNLTDADDWESFWQAQFNEVIEDWRD